MSVCFYGRILWVQAVALSRLHNVTNWHWSHWLVFEASWTGVQKWRNVHVATQGGTVEQVGSYDLVCLKCNVNNACCNILACDELYSWLIAFGWDPMDSDSDSSPVESDSDSSPVVLDSDSEPEDSVDLTTWLAGVSVTAPWVKNPGR